MKKQKGIFIFIILISWVAGQCQLLSIDIDTNQDYPKREKGEVLLHHLHKKLHGKYCKSYTFSQKNTHYSSDSISGFSEWHESIEFPDKFRIDFGNLSEGNFVIFKNDSAFSYQQFKLSKIRPNSNVLLLLLGGMYFRPFDDVIQRLKKEHFNLALLTESTWNNDPVYVIGDTIAHQSNQIWIQPKTHLIVRIIQKINDTDWMDMRFEEHQKLCNGYTETKVSFRRNGILEQTEEYFNITPVSEFEHSVFYPN